MVKKLNQKQAIDTARTYLQRLQRKGLSIERAYLYGSYAKGAEKNWSDIDLAVLSPRFNNRLDAHNYLWRRLSRAEIIKGLEPIGLHPDDFVDENPLAYWIKREGIELKI